jgi:hypothetical protein
VRANPDNSLYPGDEFTVALSPTLGPSVVSSSVSWTYDSVAFSAQTSRAGGDFTLEENVTSATTFTMTAQMNLVLKLCANRTLTSSVIRASVGVTAIPLVPVRGQPCAHIRIGDLASSTVIPDGVSEDDSNPITLHGLDNANESVSVMDFFGWLLRFQLSNVR